MKPSICMIVTEKLPVPPVRGGAIQTYIDGVLPHLSNYFDITVLGVKDPLLPGKETRSGVRYVRLLGKNNRALYENSLRRFFRRNRKAFGWIVVFNRPQYVPMVQELNPASRIVLSMHNDMFQPEKLPPSQAANIVRQLERITTVSRYVAEGIHAVVPQAAQKTRVIYSGVDVERFLPRWSPEAVRRSQAIKQKYGLEGKRVVLLVSRLSAKKGVHLVVEAMQSIKEQFPDVVLLVVGSKWYGGNRMDEYVRRVHRLAEPLGDAVRFTGYVPQSRVHDFFFTGEMFLCASQWQEPLARVHYEAMAAGLPIITTNRGGNPEVIKGQGNGIILDDWDQPAAFADAILKLLSDSDLANQMGRRGRQLAEGRFTWKRVADEWMEVLSMRAGVVVGGH